MFDVLLQIFADCVFGTFPPFFLHLKNEKSTKKGKTLTQIGLMSVFVSEELFECKVQNNKLEEAC